MGVAGAIFFQTVWLSDDDDEAFVVFSVNLDMACDVSLEKRRLREGLRAHRAHERLDSDVREKVEGEFLPLSEARAADLGTTKSKRTSDPEAGGVIVDVSQPEVLV